VEGENAAELKVENLELSFGGVRALQDVTMDVKEKEILALIGPNGAGKTCVLNCISGFYHSQKGKITYNGRDITKLPAYKVAELGLARTFQNLALYTSFTTLDNLMIGRHIQMRRNPVEGAIYFGRAHKEEIKHRRIVEDIIDLLEMEPIRKKVVGALPYGLRKKVELGRALALEPKVLLLDEPMAGMNVEEKEDMARYIIDVYELQKIPILLVEHDMGVVMDIADRIIVLDFGNKIAEGSPREIGQNPAVIKAYLGSRAR